MDVEILTVGPADDALLADCDPDVFDREIDPAHLAGYLADAGHRLVIARAAGLVIGQARAVIHHQPDEAPHLYIDNLGVAEAWRRQGLAGRLLGVLETWGREQGCTEAWVLTEDDNGPARALYEGRGGTTEAITYYTYDI
jgi:ribosomal protein S18 acetylase RimI-like enzyme